MAERPRDAQLHGQASDHSLQLGDPILFLIPLFPGLEEGLQPLDGDVHPAGDEFGLQLVVASDLGLALQAGEHFEDDPGIELRRARSATAFRHRRTLLGRPALTIVLVQS